MILKYIISLYWKLLEKKKTFYFMWLFRILNLNIGSKQNLFPILKDWLATLWDLATKHKLASNIWARNQQQRSIFSKEDRNHFGSIGIKDNGWNSNQGEVSSSGNIPPPPSVEEGTAFVCWWDSLHRLPPHQYNFLVKYGL